MVNIAKNNSIKLIKNSQAHELRPDEAGISVFDGKQWIIIYDDQVPLGRKRFTVAHELGHIFLGHSLIAGFYARTPRGTIPRVENEANIFASRFLAPACVLWGLGVHTADEIARICEISQEAATIRANRMEELYKRNMFLTSPLERRVYKQFEKFIQENRI